MKNWKQDIIYISVIVIILTYLYNPIEDAGKVPTGGDKIGATGKTHQVVEWNKDNEVDEFFCPPYYDEILFYMLVAGGVVFGILILRDK